MSKMPDEIRNTLIDGVPQEQQELIKAVFQAANRPKQGRRYTLDWVYECVLMKIKAPSLYRKLQRENKLPVPSETTLLRYMKKLRPSYGFDENVLRVLKEKSEHFDASDRRGDSLKIHLST